MTWLAFCLKNIFLLAAEQTDGRGQGRKQGDGGTGVMLGLDEGKSSGERSLSTPLACSQLSQDTQPFSMSLYPELQDTTLEFY